jgi:hypothetical protein
VKRQGLVDVELKGYEIGSGIQEEAVPFLDNVIEIREVR